MTDTYVRFHVGDVRQVLATLPDASVDLVLTSPPFLALRSYLPADDPAKVHELGSEPTPGEFLDNLLDVVEECQRVLTPHGSIAFELGDTYAGSGGAGGDYKDGGMRDGQPRFRAGYLRNDRDSRVPQAAPKAASKPKNNRFSQPDSGTRTGPGRSTAERDGWPLDKSLCLVPELFRFALVYGFNPLTGRQTPKWRARNVVRWCRPNPPVGALADKVRPATSDMLIACVGRSRYFDLDAIREPPKNGEEPGAPGGSTTGYRGITDGGERAGRNLVSHPAGAPPLDHWWYDEDTFEQDAWLISTEAYPGSHYATWPQALLERPIKAMCPMRVCTVCGKPSERIVSVEHEPNRSTNGPQSIERKHLDGGSAGYSVRADRHTSTLGWTDCGHDSWRAGVVLDPFAGSGTTLAVAHGHGRSAIGIDLDHRNVDLARQRVGMWLEEVEPVALTPSTEAAR